MFDVVLNFIIQYKIIIAVIFSYYFIFRFLNFSGLKKEKSFDVVIVYLFSLFGILKFFYFLENYQNFSSINEILLNFNFTSYSLYLVMIYNITFSIFISKFVNFSPFKISDSLSLSLCFYLVLETIKSEQFFLICLIFGLMLFFNNKFVSGFVTFFFNFVITNYFLVYPVLENNILFYIIVSSVTAFLIIRRVKFMNHLSSDFIENCRENLLKRKHRLLEDLRIIDEDVDPDRDIGNAEYMDEVSEDIKVEKNYILKKDIEQSIDKINKALKRIEEGKYGVDVSTGEPIDKARLELFPESEHNVK